MEILLIFLPLLLLIPSLLLLTKFLKKETRNLPPGPWKLPFIGNLHQMASSKHPHRTLRNLAQKYGPLMHLQMGELSTIVVSSPKLAKEVLYTNSLAFANRPNLTVAQVISYNTLGVAFSNYGDYWKQMRQIYIKELLSAKCIQSLFDIMEDELSSLSTFIASQNGKPIVLGEVISSYMSSTVSRATVGRMCKDKDLWIAATKEATLLATIFNPEDLFPSVTILRHLTRMRPRLEKLYRELDVILEDLIDTHEKDQANAMEQDILDVLLQLEKNNDFQFPLTRSNIKAIIFELSIAGTVTSSDVVEWAMSEIMKNPRILERAQTEIREALKGKERISKSDIQGLKYLKCLVKETLRLHPPGPLLAPHVSREECEVGGYKIPAGTVALVNVWAIGRDPEHWDDPEVFEPERFSESSVDFTGNSFELLPFGAGRRICPGMSFGVTNVELLLAQLLYYFNWELPAGMMPDELDMAEKIGASPSRKSELRLIATVRKP